MQIFMSFYEWHMLQLNTANFLYGLSISNGSPVLLDCIKFPTFDGLNDIFQNSIGPWPLLQKGRKIPAYDIIMFCFAKFMFLSSSFDELANRALSALHSLAFF